MFFNYFASKNQLLFLSVREALVENGLTVKLVNILEEKYATLNVILSLRNWRITRSKLHITSSGHIFWLINQLRLSIEIWSVNVKFYPKNRPMVFNKASNLLYFLRY